MNAGNERVFFSAGCLVWDEVCVPMSSLGKAGPSCSFLCEEGEEMEKPRERSWRECLGLGKIQRPLRERMGNSQKGK